MNRGGVLKDKRYVAICSCSFGNWFCPQPYRLGGKRFRARTDVGTSSRARTAADAFTVSTAHPRRSSIRFRFRVRIRTVCCLLAGESLLAPIENAPRVFLLHCRLAGWSTNVLSRIG